MIIDVDSDSSNQQEIQNPIKSLVSGKQRNFDCKNGFLYEDGVYFGKCLDFVLKNGIVYDKTNKFLGKIEN